MKKTFNMPVSQWRRNFYASTKGIPSVKSIKQEIDAGRIPGGCVAGKYHVCCYADYSLDNSKLPVKTFVPDPPPEVSNETAKGILQQIGLQ